MLYVSFFEDGIKYRIVFFLSSDIFRHSIISAGLGMKPWCSLLPIVVCYIAGLSVCEVVGNLPRLISLRCASHVYLHGRSESFVK